MATQSSNGIRNAGKVHWGHLLSMIKINLGHTEFEVPRGQGFIPSKRIPIYLLCARVVL